MSRRALPKIDSELDLSYHLIEFDQLPVPFDAAKLFDRPAPLEVEVGSGKGLFLSGAASENAAHNFLGIEMAAKYARYAASRLAKRELPNARLIHGDACRLFGELLPSDSLAAVHVYFPDPWWKARHKKRRVMNESMVQNIERVLQRSHHAPLDESGAGTLHFWTDVEEYFHTTLELLAGHTKLTGPHDVREKPADHDLDYRTHFERRKRQAGLPIYRAEFRKP
jgi:tRNA (guanine-N7-)-methyltransferase